MIADVAAVIPVRNEAALICEALQSVFEQTVRPREIIVVDDGSTDGTENIVRRYPGIIYERQTSSGAAAARNTGVRRSSMPFLSFLDADDLWHPAKTECQLQLMASRPDLDIISGQMQNFRRSPSGSIIALGKPSDSHLLTALLVRRDSFFRVGPLASTWTVGETIDWWARAIDLCLLYDSVPSVVYLRRVHTRNLVNSVGNLNREYLRLLHAILQRRRDSQSEK